MCTDVIQLGEGRHEASNAVADAGTSLDARDEDEARQDGKIST